MKGFYYINFADLSQEAQEEIINTAKEEIEADRKKDLKKQSKQTGISYEVILQEQAERHIYSFNYVFNI